MTLVHPLASRLVRRLVLLLAALVGALALSLGMASSAEAAAPTDQVVVAALQVPLADVEAPVGPEGPAGVTNGTDVTVDFTGVTDKPSSSVSVILAVTLISLVPAILFTCTSFTKILVVLSLTRNALGLQQTPPNQVLVGLALFLSVFIMSPVLSEINTVAVQPYLAGDLSSSAAWSTGVEPLKAFMLKNTDDSELRMLTNIADRPLPANRTEVSLDTLVPAFILSELKDAFTIGFIIFLPFLVIDIVVSGALMALGMMMMPPVMVSLPFKLLLFVLVNGWGLLLTALVSSYGTG